MIAREPIKASACRWQFLFPQGLREVYRLPDKQTVVTTYNHQTLARIVDDFDRMMQLRRTFGMPAQSVPVSLLHGIMKGDVPELRRRVAHMHALRYHDGSGGIPAGVWGLTEWTPEGLQLLESGQWKALSPTTENMIRTEDGKVHKGLFLTEVGLVDEGFFSTIGGVNDFVSVDHWPIAEEWLHRPVVRTRATRYAGGIETRGSSMVVDLQSQPLMRQASHKGESMESEVNDAIGTDDTKVMVDEALVEAVMERMKPRMAEEFTRMCNERGYVTREDMQAMMREIATTTVKVDDASGEHVAVPAVSEVAADVEVEDAEVPAMRSKALMAKALDELRSEALALATDEARALMRERKLPVARAESYIARTLAGESVAHLLVDRNALGAAAGHAGCSTDGTGQPDTIILSREATKLRAAVLAEGKHADESSFHAEVNKRLMQLRDAAQKRGARVIDYESELDED